MLISRQLIYFTSLAKELHFGRTAEFLHITQSALSQSIRSMERSLGLELFERDRQGVQLTDAGRALLEEAEELVEQSERALRAVRRAAQGCRGTLRILYSRSGVHLGQRGLVEEFRRRYPGVDVRTEAGWAAHNLEALQAGAADVAFLRTPPCSSDVATHVVSHEELVAVVPVGSTVASSGEVVSPEELRGEPVVTWPRSQAPELYDRILAQVWRTEGPSVGLVEPDYANVIEAVRAGHGIAVLDRRLAETAGQDGLVIRRFVPPRPVGEVSVAWLRGATAPVLRRFIGFLRAERPTPVAAMKVGVTAG
ncbi:LysR family transcriptional regulator [Streptomyces sp. S186]|uniref:LysR family transcriptional regulator n=1 Tax=Streptomyces sp. S186 TaxID=3434395 RepID=UPI003F66D0DE